MLFIKRKYIGKDGKLKTKDLEVVNTKEVKTVEGDVIGIQYNYKRENGTIGVQYVTKDKTRTQQHQKDETDINKIVRKYGNKDIFNKFVFDTNDDNVIDVSEIGDYEESLKKVVKAQEQFDMLPSHIRKEFNNNPKNLVEFTHEAVNGDQLKMEKLYKLGLAVKTPEKVVEPLLVKNVDVIPEKQVKKEVSNA